MIDVWYLADAVADLEHAHTWYEEQRQGLGDEFLDAIDAAVQSLLAFPEAHPIIYRDARRCLVSRFPYCLYYHVRVDKLIVLACLHIARDPKRHRLRLLP